MHISDQIKQPPLPNPQISHHGCVKESHAYSCPLGVNTCWSHSYVIKYIPEAGTSTMQKQTVRLTKI